MLKLAKNKLFSPNKSIVRQLFVRHHYSEAKTRDFIEIVSILASKSQNAAFHGKDLLTQKCLKLAENKLFSPNKSIVRQHFVLHHLPEAKTRDFIEIVSILASKSQNAAFHRKDLYTQKCLKLA